MKTNWKLIKCGCSVGLVLVLFYCGWFVAKNSYYMKTNIHIKLDNKKIAIDNTDSDKNSLKSNSTNIEKRNSSEYEQARKRIYLYAIDPEMHALPQDVLRYLNISDLPHIYRCLDDIELAKHWPAIAYAACILASQDRRDQEALDKITQILSRPEDLNTQNIENSDMILMNKVNCIFQIYVLDKSICIPFLLCAFQTKEGAEEILSGWIDSKLPRLSQRDSFVRVLRQYAAWALAYTQDDEAFENVRAMYNSLKPRAKNNMSLGPAPRKEGQVKC